MLPITPMELLKENKSDLLFIHVIKLQYVLVKTLQTVTQFETNKIFKEEQKESCPPQQTTWPQPVQPVHRADT